jgi:hypothetical protein
MSNESPLGIPNQPGDKIVMLKSELISLAKDIYLDGWDGQWINSEQFEGKAVFDEKTFKDTWSAKWLKSIGCEVKE